MAIIEKEFKQTNDLVPDYDAIFSSLCKQYNISWDTATKKEKTFIKEVARVTYEVQLAKANRTSIDKIRPSFTPPD